MAPARSGLKKKGDRKKKKGVSLSDQVKVKAEGDAKLNKKQLKAKQADLASDAADHDLGLALKKKERENRASRATYNIRVFEERAARVWHAKAIIRELMEKRQIAREKLHNAKAWMIQMEARRYNARKELKRRWEEFDRRWEAAIFLQTYWRNRQQTMMYIFKALRKKQQREEAAAKLMAANRLIATWRMVMTWRLVRITWKRAATQIERVARGRKGRLKCKKLRYMYAVRIQRAWHCKVENDYLKILLQRLKTEHERKPPEVTPWVNRAIINAKKGLGDASVEGGGEYRYSNPGMVKGSKPFMKVLNQRKIGFEKVPVKELGKAKMRDIGSFRPVRIALTKK